MNSEENKFFNVGNEDTQASNNQPVASNQVPEVPVVEPVVNTPVQEVPVVEPVVSAPVQEVPVVEPVVSAPVQEVPVVEPVVSEPVQEVPVNEPIVSTPVQGTPFVQPVNNNPMSGAAMNNVNYGSNTTNNSGNNVVIMVVVIALLAIIAVAVYFIFNGDSKTLKCTMTDDSTDGMEMTQVVKLTYKKDELTKMNMTMEIAVSEEYEAYLDFMKSSFTEEFSYLEDEDGIELKTDDTKNGMSFTIEADFAKMDEDTREELVDGAETYEEAKESFEEEGYTCK